MSHESFVFREVRFQVTYDVIKKQFWIEEPFDGRIGAYYIPDHCEELVAALMTSTTIFYYRWNSVLFYARSMLWYYDKYNIYCHPLMHDQHWKYFDNSPMSITMTSKYVIAHQYRNAVLLNVYHMPESNMQPIVIAFPITFRILSLADSERNQGVVLHDTMSNKTLYCFIKPIYEINYDLRRSTKITLKITVKRCLFETDEDATNCEVVDIGAVIIY